MNKNDEHGLFKKDQYSLKEILLIWVCSALPMPLLAFLAPAKLAGAVNIPLVISFWLCLVGGLFWQFLLSLLILKKEGHAFFSFETWKNRLKFQLPKNPKTGKSNPWLFIAVLPFIGLNAVISADIGFPDLDSFISPYFENLPKYDLSGLASPEYQGAWWILGLYLVTFAFNYILGEEMIYRGILLPKMKGVFGKWDWAANGVLFGMYHLHKPQIIFSTALLFGFVFAFPSSRLQSSWMAVIIHGLEGLLGLALVLAVILGMG
ncbi:CPBP family intramembrane glutamic endopeptidase [Algoriphagus confluentis]|uniref:CAAX prenyl protease 2/Lysostaphin resistance protein A-like domain-containing protein n=1 Tax=Algoriphagus confluentis TaxID=1697556 RepID=A0ABQ6PVC2_9BACT|nr:hypothetical protein Aconfl_41570 [Algoriphagus confluentis]